jgi:hypothetical protein
MTDAAWRTGRVIGPMRRWPEIVDEYLKFVDLRWVCEKVAHEFAVADQTYTLLHANELNADNFDRLTRFGTVVTVSFP